MRRIPGVFDVGPYSSWCVVDLPDTVLPSSAFDVDVDAADVNNTAQRPQKLSY